MTNQLPCRTLKSPFMHMVTYPVLIILMQFHTAFLRLPPSLGHSIIDIGLMDNLGDELGPVVNSWGIRRRNLGTVNGVGGTVFDEKSKEGEDGADEEDDY